MTRPRASVLTVLLAVLVGLVLAGGVVVGDRVAQGRVEQAVARGVQAELQTPTTPLVYLRGFPFVPQLLIGRFSSVRVVAENVLLPDQTTPPARALDLVCSGVTGEDGYARIRARHVEGVAVLDYAALPRVGGQALTYAGNNRVSVDLLPDLAGVPLEAKVVGRPVLDVPTQTITFSETRIEVAGVRVREEMARPLLRSVLRPVPLAGVAPWGLRLSGLSVDATGVSLGLVGDDVVLRG